MLTKQRITNTVEKWYVIEPLFFAVWTTHALAINPNIQTIRVGNGHIEYNPDFIDNLNNKMLEQVLRFEVMRIILKHPYLRRKENQTVAYVASNITLQEYLQTSLPFPTAREVFQTDEFDRKYFELYYYQLLNQIAEGRMGLMGGLGSMGGGSGPNDQQTDSNAQGGQQDDSQNRLDSNNQGEPDSNNQEDSNVSEKKTEKKGPPQNLESYAHPETSGVENTELWQTNEYLVLQVNDRIEWALENNSWGNIPSHVQELILATLKPKVNYRDILKAFRASILSVNRSLTRMKPSRRYGFQYMGSRRDFCTKLLFAVDVSGSVSTYDVRNAFSIVNQFFKYGIPQIEVLQFDTEIKGEPLALDKARSKIQVIGRGGTNFQSVINYIDNNKGYDGLIIFTDGYAPIPSIPKNKRTRVLWLFNNEDNYKNLKNGLRTIGRSAFIKDN
jgi:predicted metal-dependent peptidase